MWQSSVYPHTQGLNAWAETGRMSEGVSEWGSWWERQATRHTLAAVSLATRLPISAVSRSSHQLLARSSFQSAHTLKPKHTLNPCGLWTARVLYTLSPRTFFSFSISFVREKKQFFTPAIILLLKCMRIRYFFYYYYKIGYYSGRSCMVFQTVGTIQTGWISSVSRFTDHFLHRLSLSKEMWTLCPDSPSLHVTQN